MKDSISQLEFIVPAEHAGERLDRFLSLQMPETSRTRVQSLIDEGRVRVDGVARKPSVRIVPGESVTVEIPPAPPAGVESEDIPLEILYEDEDVAVVNKPAGMVVHPGAGVGGGTMVAALLHRFGGIEGLSTVGGPMRPGIVHRLDKETSGALVIARNNTAHHRLVEEFRERLVEKSYLALLHGRVKNDAGSVELPIARDLRRRSRKTARRREGRQARTDWRVILRFSGHTLVEARIHTGRTHQIRVHFSALGCPVVGDTLYGAPRQEHAGSELVHHLGRNFLHAARVAFAHPRTGERVEIRAPLPPELWAYVKDLARVSGTDQGLVDAALRNFL